LRHHLRTLCAVRRCLRPTRRSLRRFLRALAEQRLRLSHFGVLIRPHVFKLLCGGRSHDGGLRAMVLRIYFSDSPTHLLTSLGWKPCANYSLIRQCRKPCGVIFTPASRNNFFTRSRHNDSVPGKAAEPKPPNCSARDRLIGMATSHSILSVDLGSQFSKSSARVAGGAGLILHLCMRCVTLSLFFYLIHKVQPGMAGVIFVEADFASRPARVSAFATRQHPFFRPAVHG
jgi:hypothetical protein